jgi:hypothetical protein
VEVLKRDPHWVAVFNHVAFTYAKHLRKANKEKKKMSVSDLTCGVL